MPSYIVETYLTHGQAPERPAREAQARAAAAELTQEGKTVRFDAPSAHQAALTAQRAGLDPIRVVEALTTERLER